MVKSEVKNIIIIILALVNAALLLLLVSDAAQSAASRRARDEAIMEVLSERSISLGDGISLDDFAPSELTLNRDLAEEEASLRELIGKSHVSDMGGEIIVYTGSMGTAKFYGDGSFEILVTSNSHSLGNSPAKSALTLLKKIGIECTEDGAAVVKDNETVDVTLQCSYKGLTVFGTSVTCTYTNGQLDLIQGRRPLDTEASEIAPESYPDAATIIMSFLRHIDSTGEVCTTINAIDPGYFADSPQIGIFKLRPVWRVTINGGKTYYFDSFTGSAVSFDG